MDAKDAVPALASGLKSPFLLAIDGRCAAGKTTLTTELAEQWDCNVIHMDDFYLPFRDRTPERMEKLISYMESKGAKNVLGRDPDTRIPGLNHDRALCTQEGVGSSDVIVVPIEDGDRAEALVAMGKKVISLDLNPLSRTSRMATVPISDEISRALANITAYVKELRGKDAEIDALISSYSARKTREGEIEAICGYLMSEFSKE